MKHEVVSGVRIQLVTFDLDDTLWAVQPVLQHAEQALIEWLHTQTPHIGEMTSGRWQQLKREVVAQAPQLAYQVSRCRYEVLLKTFLDAGDSAFVAAESAEAAFQVFLSARQNVQLFDDAQPTLRQLRQHYTLGAISNGNADVRRVGLAEYFAFALNADGLGVAKPAASVFETALARAQVKPWQAVHVGDHPRDDICGAQQVGMHTIWFNPQGLAWQGKQPPSAQVQRLAQVVEALRQL